MFNNNEQIINCYTCGDITEQLIKNGKVIKNCQRCREINNNKKKQYKNNEPPINLEPQPINGFYKQEHFIIADNVKQDLNELDTNTDNITENTELENTELLNTELENTELDNTELENTELDNTEIDNTNVDTPKEKTIKDLITDILTKLDKIHYTPPPDKDNTTNNITERLEHLNNNINSLLNNSNTTTDTELQEFIKKQNLQNKIILNKIDNIIKAIT